MVTALFTFWMTRTNLSEGSTTINYNHKGLRETHNGNTKDTFWFGRSCSTVLAKIRLNSLTRGTRPGCVLGQKSATFRIENSQCWIWLRSLPPPLSQRRLWMVPYQKAPVPQTRSNHQTEAGTLTIRITTSCNKVLILRTRYLWTKSDIIVHSVVFYEEVGSFSLCCRGCFRGCSYSLLYYYEVCRFNPSQQPLILESADLGLHSGNFDSYYFHF